MIDFRSPDHYSGAPLATYTAKKNEHYYEEVDSPYTKLFVFNLAQMHYTRCHSFEATFPKEVGGQWKAIYFK